MVKLGNLRMDSEHIQEYVCSSKGDVYSITIKRYDDNDNTPKRIIIFDTEKEYNETVKRLDKMCNVK